MTFDIFWAKWFLFLSTTTLNFEILCYSISCQDSPLFWAIINLYLQLKTYWLADIGLCNFLTEDEILIASFCFINNVFQMWMSVLLGLNAVNTCALIPMAPINVPAVMATFWRIMASRANVSVQGFKWTFWIV